MNDTVDSDTRPSSHGEHVSTDDDAQLPVKPYRLDTTVAPPARRYNYWIGGKDHFAADRESGEAILAAFPAARAAALENRAFLRRAVTYLTAEAGVRQFLDIGTGIPAPDNTHEVAQAIAPESRVVYVDNDPIVLTHARALLSSSPQGATAYLEEDLHDFPKILEHPEVTGTLDLTQPVALLLVAVLHFVHDEDDPYEMVAGLLDGLPVGSYLASRMRPPITPRPASRRRSAPPSNTARCTPVRVAVSPGSSTA